MVTVAVLSAAYGDHLPPPAPPKQSVSDVRFLVVTDRPKDAPGWEQTVRQQSHLPPRLAAKLPKMRPDWFTLAEVVIWVDAQFTVRSPRFVEWCLDGLGDSQFATLPHPRRGSLIEEAKAGQGGEGRGRFAGQDTLGQAEHYLARGHPDGWGMWATGLHVRRVTPDTILLGARWLEETVRWGTHDQVSFPHVARTTVGEVVTLPWLGWSNEYWALTGPRHIKRARPTGKRAPARRRH